MALSNSYVLPHKRIPEVFAKIKDAQAPDRFTIQLLKDWGLTSTNDRAFIPLLKSLGFLTADGHPTQRYNDYRDHSISEVVMAEALKEAYSDIFLIKAKPSSSDRKAIEGKFKSFHNVSDNLADLMCKTFLGLLNIADLGGNIRKPVLSSSVESDVGKEKTVPEEQKQREESVSLGHPALSGLHYNIQIHLPATKDIEVYNSIFKSLKEHLLEE